MVEKGYSVRSETSRPNPEEGQREGAKSILNGMNAIATEDAIARAKRSGTDAADRQWTMGPNVGKMVRQLVFWDGKGSDDDDRIHKTAREWFQSEAGLTERQLRTARRIAVEEGLVEVTVGRRPSDGQKVNFYRLNMWQTARVVVESELENTNRKLAHEGRKRVRDRLNKQRRGLERTQEDLNLFVERNSGDSEREGGTDKMSGPSCQFAAPTGEYQESTSVSSLKDTPVGEDAEAGKSMQEVYDHMKEAGYRLDNEEYRFNLTRVRSLLDHDAPTAEELQELPEACREYFVIHGKLDARKALRRMRQQAARSEMMAAAADEEPQASNVSTMGMRGWEDFALTPRAAVEALKNAKESWVRQRASLAELHDFTSEQQPTSTAVWMRLGNDGPQREKTWKQMRRIARSAVPEKQKESA
jgi:hypothetical protein